MQNILRMSSEHDWFLLCLVKRQSKIRSIISLDDPFQLSSEWNVQWVSETCSLIPNLSNA